MNARLLMIDRDPEANSYVIDRLERAGHETRIFESCKAACGAIDALRPSVVLIGDLAGELRFEACRNLRRLAPAWQTSIIVALPPEAALTRIQCLEEGADDIVSKPIAPQNLLSQIHAIVERARRNNSPVILGHGPITMNLDQHKVRAAGTLVHLSPTGFRLLRLLIERPDQPLTRKELCTALGRDGGNVKACFVDGHVGRLRAALAPVGLASLIVTIRPVGYMLAGG